jgi:hypothetical protein
MYVEMPLPKKFTAAEHEAYQWLYDASQPLPDDPREFERSWSHVSGYRAAFTEAAAIVMRRATEAWQRDETEIASALKEAAREIREQEGMASLALNRFIKASEKRSR